MSTKTVNSKYFESLKESPGDNTFQVDLSKKGGGRVRAWRQVLDRHDGSFLVLYRAYESADELFINVKYNGKDVAESPYVLKGNGLVLCTVTEMRVGG